MNNEREERAFKALIVSQIRTQDETDPEYLPELTGEEQAAVDSLGDGFLRKLLAGEIQPAVTSPESDMPAVAGEIFGLNRAKDLDDETREELDRKRQEIIDQVNKEEEEKSDPDS